MPQPYHSLEAELHDAFWDAEDHGSEIRLMERFLKKHPGKALEIGCGSGRLMFPLLAAGLDIEGLELSPDMLALGEIRARRLDVSPTVHRGDMCTWRPRHPYASLLAPAFTLLLAADPSSTLRHWHSLLLPGGGLYLTIFMPHAELSGDLPENQWYDDHEVTLPDGRHGKLRTRHRIDRKNRLLHRDHRYSLDGNPPLTHESSQTLRWIEHREMLTLLTRNGFQTDCHFLDFDPRFSAADPDGVDFDGILTYHATRAS